MAELAGCSSSSTGAASGPTTPSTDITSAVVVSVPPVSVGDRVTEWFAQVEDDWGQIQAAQSEIADAAGSQDVDGVIGGCRQLKQDVVKFETDPAAPDPKLRAYLAEAMDLYSTAATLCTNADLTGATEQLTKANGLVKRATGRIRELKGS